MQLATNLKKITSSFILVILSLSCLTLTAQKKKRVFTTKNNADGFVPEKFSLIPINSFIVKFTEGTKIRQRGNKFLALNSLIKAKELLLLKDNQLKEDEVMNELEQLNSLLKGFQNMTVKRYFDRPEQEIDQEQDTLEDKINEELADLNLYYLFVLRSGDGKELINSLNQFKIVENAYPVYKSENAVLTNDFTGKPDSILNITDEFSDQQGYLNAAPKGINAKYAWTLNGGKGDGIRIIDIEDQWDINHEDLKPPFWISSSTVNSNGTERGDHGTAVLGEIVAKHNHFGVKGISPDAAYGISGVTTLASHTRAVSAAIDKASRLLKAGDIILIEQHTPGPKSGKIDSTCNPRQLDYVPMEFYQDCFDAIRRATAKGIIIVEAAGNGGVDLDAAIYKNLFTQI